MSQGLILLKVRDRFMLFHFICGFSMCTQLSGRSERIAGGITTGGGNQSRNFNIRTHDTVNKYDLLSVCVLRLQAVRLAVN